jgi:hypothetical protein
VVLSYCILQLSFFFSSHCLYNKESVHVSPSLAFYFIVFKKTILRILSVYSIDNQNIGNLVAYSLQNPAISAI